MAPLACVTDLLEPGWLHPRSSANILVLWPQQPTSLLPEMHFEFPFKLIGKSTMGQS